MTRLPPTLSHIASLGHKVFQGDGDYDLNLIGVRSPYRVANEFDDWMACFYQVAGTWRAHWWQITTDPGAYWLENPMQVTGTAILVPGQYRGVWKIDKHQGKYEALCQRNGTVRVYRDNDEDEILEMDSATIQEGSFGINIHRSSRTGSSSVVNRWSAGCQVFQKLDDFDLLMALARKQIGVHPTWTTFTYTLTDQWWIDSE